MTRIGLIGAGRWGRNAARAMAKAGVLAWVCDVDADAAKRLGDEFGVIAYDNIDTALNTRHVSGCWVASPIETHELLVHRLLGEGLHVLCEKPLARTKAQAADLADEAKRRGLVLMADHTWMAHHSARTVVDAGGIVRYSARRFAKDERGFDPLEDLLPHDVVLAVKAQGPVRGVRVAGGLMTSIAMFHDGHTEGEPLDINNDARWFSKANVPDRDVRAQVGISNAHYSYDSDEKVRQMESWTRDAYRVTGGELPANAPEPLSVIIDTFLDAIRTGQPPTIGSADEFVHVAAVIEAAKKSRASGGGWVDVA